MNRWISLLGAVMLVLTLWTGSAAHAAERFDCLPLTAEAGAHYDGDRDQVPSTPDQGVAHHHSGCSGHHVAAPATLAEASLFSSGMIRRFPLSDTAPPGPDAENHLRPPIA